MKILLGKASYQPHEGIVAIVSASYQGGTDMIGLQVLAWIKRILILGSNWFNYLTERKLVERHSKKEIFHPAVN
jgi:hypothetical protein